MYYEFCVSVANCADPIDLTKEGDQDMQKALMLSMQDMQSVAGGGVLSLEEQELSRSVGGAHVEFVGVVSPWVGGGGAMRRDREGGDKGGGRKDQDSGGREERSGGREEGGEIRRKGGGRGDWGGGEFL
jgi:hypothetical protein